MTGTTGFIGGHHLLWRSHGQGHIHALVRGRSLEKATDRLYSAAETYAASYGIPFDRRAWQDRVTVEVGDITRPALGLSPESIARLLEANIDEVWHFAATLQFAQRQRDQIYQHNVHGTRQMLEFARMIGALRFVYVSTAYTVGRFEGSVAEDLHALDHEYSNVYEESKCVSEYQVMTFCRENGIDARILRPSIVVGPSLTHRSGGSTSGLYGLATEVYRLRRLVADADDFTLVGDPDVPMNIIPVDQVVRDMLYLEQNDFPNGPIYHLTADQEVTAREVIDAVCVRAGVKPPPLVKDRGRERTPLEELLDDCAHFYGAYCTHTKKFERSIPFATGIGSQDLDAYVRFFMRELEHNDAASLFERNSVYSDDGVPVNAYCAGRIDAPPLLLVNAYGMPIEFWTPMARDLSRTHRLLTWESRYVPNMTDAFDPNRCDLTVQVEDMSSVMDHFCVGCADIIAWCSGAQVALEFASRYPERVRSMILLNGTYCGGDSIPRTDFQRNFINLITQIASDRRKAALYHRLIHGGTGDGQTSRSQRSTITTMIEGLDPLLLHMTSAPFRNPEVLYRYSTLFDRFFAGPEFDGSRRLPVRSLVVTTPTDVISHPNASVEMSRRLPRGTLLRLPTGDHYSLYFDRELPDIVRGFVQAA